VTVVSQKLRVVFLGSPEFAVPTLEAVAARHDVVLAVAQPDKPAGRGMKVASPAVKLAAERLGIAVAQPKSARTPDFAESLRALAPDVAVVVAYGKILPQAVLDIPKHGCLNVHGSILPRYRGAAPIQWAVIRGERETGITIMQLDAGMDTGPMLMVRTLPIGDEDTSGTLAPRLSALGAELMIEALERLQAGQLTATPQDDAQATMAPMLEKTTGRVDWTQPARAVSCLVRGVDPWPGAYTELAGAPGAPADVLKLWTPSIVEGRGAPGTVLGADRSGLVVACGEGAVAIGELQLPGKKRLPAAALLSGRAIPAGTVLGVAAAAAAPAAP
jgi:methionyl-tRNA formyltransferase